MILSILVVTLLYFVGQQIIVAGNYLLIIIVVNYIQYPRGSWLYCVFITCLKMFVQMTSTLNSKEIRVNAVICYSLCYLRKADVAEQESWMCTIGESVQVTTLLHRFRSSTLKVSTSFFSSLFPLVFKTLTKDRDASYWNKRVWAHVVLTLYKQNCVCRMKQLEFHAMWRMREPIEGVWHRMWSSKWWLTHLHLYSWRQRTSVCRTGTVHTAGLLNEIIHTRARRPSAFKSVLRLHRFHSRNRNVSSI